jgi:tRNA uridine 5-carboxymethylaminomethyl modification enzyme
MDVSQAVTGYLTKMISVGDSTSGTQSAKMKILLLDRDTVRPHPAIAPSG